MAWQYHTVLSLPLADPLRADSSHRYANHTKRGRGGRGEGGHMGHGMRPVCIHYVMRVPLF